MTTTLKNNHNSFLCVASGYRVAPATRNEHLTQNYLTGGPASKVEHHKAHDHGNMLLTTARKMIELSWWGSLEGSIFFFFSKITHFEMACLTIIIRWALA